MLFSSQRNEIADCKRNNQNGSPQNPLAFQHKISGKKDAECHRNDFSNPDEETEGSDFAERADQNPQNSQRTDRKHSNCIRL
ncbi:MAG TPA: hypothetical protein DEO40_05595 [Treponema sp.]|nr:hypothetical protein [Treponema sp.]